MTSKLTKIDQSKSAKIQASPRMVTCSVQTYEQYVDQSSAQKTTNIPRFTPTHNYESFETDKYLVSRSSSNRSEPVRMMKSRPEHDFSRLEGKNKEIVTSSILYILYINPFRLYFSMCVGFDFQPTFLDVQQIYTTATLRTALIGYLIYRFLIDRN